MAREMKNSGVQWIGEIPSNWNTIQLKRHSHVVSGKEVKVELEPEDENAVPVYGSGGVFKYTDREQYNGEVVMFGRKGTIGKPLYVNDSFWAVDTMYFLIHERAYLFPKFNYYQLSAFNWELYTTQTALPSIVASQILDSKFPFPPLSEQKSIADFLDAKCGEIDGLLADLDAEVKTLTEYKKSIIAETVTRGLNPNAPMKSSGILWAESIPAHWGVEKFRYKLKPKKIVGQGDKEVLSVYREYGVVIKSSRDDNHNRTSEDTSNYKYVQPNDFVINKMKAWQGSMGVSNYEGIVSPAYFVYSFRDEDYLPKFFHYYMRNANNIPEYRRLSGGIREGQWDLSPYDLGNMPIILPPIDEQIEIANYLDSKCAAIDQAITDKTQQIETLKAYKSSLIYEYVTGKKQVAL